MNLEKKYPKEDLKIKGATVKALLTMRDSNIEFLATHTFHPRSGYRKDLIDMIDCELYKRGV